MGRPRLHTSLEMKTHHCIVQREKDVLESLLNVRLKDTGIPLAFVTSVIDLSRGLSEPFTKIPRFLMHYPCCRGRGTLAEIGMKRVFEGFIPKYKRWTLDLAFTSCVQTNHLYIVDWRVVASLRSIPMSSVIPLLFDFCFQLLGGLFIVSVCTFLMIPWFVLASSFCTHCWFCALVVFFSLPL